MSVFEVRDDFYLDGKPFQVIAGAIHYFRVVPEYWEDRMRKLIAMGGNVVETYIPWNFHEPRKGAFDFTGRRDVEAFVRLAQKLGLYVILRPSPYICSEWDLGGIPSWLLKEDRIRLRCCDPKYLGHVSDYYDELIPRLAPLQVTHGGPVIMMQVENEYGSFGDDTAYEQFLVDGMRSRGIDVPLFTADGPNHDMLSCGQVPGVFQIGNFGSKTRQNFAFMESFGIKPQMCGEFWAGWFEAWGADKHLTTDPVACAKEFEDMLDLGHVNIYMFHGGTSFGLMPGANDVDKLTPDVTSYDFDAPLSEDGRMREKYHLFRQAVQKRRKEPLPPADFPLNERRGYGKAQWKACANLLDAADQLEKVPSLTPVSMERVDQDYGYILYRTTLTKEKEIRSLQLVGAADRAKVYLDGKLILTQYDRELQHAHHFDTPVPVRPGAKLDILVENMGRVNYSYKLEMQRKGIDQAVLINEHQHYYWDIVRLDEKGMLALPLEEGNTQMEGPGVYELTFTVDHAADTFLEVPHGGKGVVFLNDFTLGKFWEIGPQKRLFIPAPLLKTGENVLRIVETEGKFCGAVLQDEPDLG